MVTTDLFNDEAERTLLGIELVDNSKIPLINCKVTSEEFFTVSHKTIQNAILDLYRRGKPVDIVSVSEYLRFNGELDQCGGREYISLLAEETITVSNYDYYCKVVAKYSKKRRLLSLTENIQKELNSSGNDVEDIASRGKLELEDIMLNRSSDCLTELYVGLEGTVDQIEHIVNSDGKILGYATGFEEIDKALSGLCPGRLYILGARPAMGKGYSLETLTLTPTGWVKNKDIKLGDTVIGRDGKPTKVIGVYPQPLQDCYKLYLKDGREIVCDAPHEWTVYSSKWGKERTFTAEELYKKLQCVRYQNRISLPRFTGDYGEEKEFVIPPYIMGVLIGDGCLSSGDLSYCKPSQLVLDNVRRYLPRGVEANFRGNNKTVGITNWKEAREYIKTVGLDTQCWNKFIPQEYFHSSKVQREELFKGLMDTDGYNTGKGYEYSTTSERLAKDIQQLAWSLGYNCRIDKRMGRYTKDNQTIETRLNYRLYITNDKPLTITKIEKVEPIPTQCIHVDNEDKLFVVEDYLVTHNSAMAFQIAENISKSHKVVFASLEMSTTDYVQRMVFSKTGLSQERLSRGMFNPDTIYDEVYATAEDIANLKLYIIDDSNCTLNKIESGIVSCIAKYGACDMVVVDYLQLMASDNPTERDSYKIVSANSTGLKKLARKYNIPILALCQLSRALEVRQDKRPILSDLRDSGAIEQDADCVMFIYREEVYDPSPINKGAAELIIAKNRQGRICTVPMVFEAVRTRFREVIK